MVPDTVTLLTEDNASRLVMLLEKHTRLELPEKFKRELVKDLRRVRPLETREFSYKLPQHSLTIEDAEEETKTHLYVRRLLNNRTASHTIPSDGERIAQAYQARARGGTSTQIYLQNILENPDLIRMMEEACDDQNQVSLLGRVAKDTQISSGRKVRMRRPVLVIPGWHEATEVRNWERYGPETKYFEMKFGIPIWEITREEYDAIINAKHAKKTK